MDVVNAYFRKFYPADYATNWETHSIGNSVVRRYTGNRLTSNPIFPMMKCADGFSMSVQGHFGAYSWPRDDFADEPYRTVEVWCLSKPEPLFDKYGTGENPLGNVPVSLVEQVIEKHGGLVE
jgi:hypothetical protein